MKTHQLRIYKRKWRYLTETGKKKYQQYNFYATLSMRLISDSKGDAELTARGEYYKSISDEARRTSLDYAIKARHIAAKIKRMIRR